MGIEPATLALLAPCSNQLSYLCTIPFRLHPSRFCVKRERYICQSRNEIGVHMFARRNPSQLGIFLHHFCGRRPKNYKELKAKHTSSILASQPCEIGNFFENKDIHTLIRSGKAFPNCACNPQNVAPA
ncbi:uncharacterized protein LOC114593894 isoform X2 [Podarcis muralis]